MTIQDRKANFEAWRAAPPQPVPPASRAYLDAYLANIDESAELREARAIAAWWAVMPLGGWPGEELAGLMCHNEPVYFFYGAPTAIDEHIVAELRGRGDSTIDADVALVRERVYKPADPEVYTEEEMRSIESGAATSTWFSGHLPLDFERILYIGLDGYARDIALCREVRTDRGDFYEALDTVLAALINLIERYADKHGGEIGERLRHIAHHGPRTFHEGLQLVWLLHAINDYDSFGRTDWYLHPFYEADIAAGRLTYERARELVCELVLKVEAIGAIQNMTIGGTDGAGRDFYPPLTRIIIDVTRELGYKGPNLCLRVTPTMPDEVWEAALGSIATGIGLPALYNDGLFTKSLVRRGVPVELARGYTFAGCSQIMVPGMCNFVNDIGILNVAKVAELAAHGGFDPRTGRQAGPETKPAAECASFDELMDAFWTQLEYFIALEVSIHNRELPYRHSREGYVMRTLFTRDCISNGINLYDGGARFNNIELEVIGITNAADHLYAFKQAAFGEGVCTAGELADALRSDWEGRDGLRRHCKEKIAKFGNDCAEVDDLRAQITRYVYRRFNESEGVHGGVFVPGEVIFIAHEYCGVVTGATADGRSAYSVLADSAGASQGFDQNGPTALFNSVLKLPVGDYLLTSTVLNVRFLPAMFEGTRDRVRALFEAFFAGGGMQLQINVCDADTLRRAQENPEEYKNLVVRVGGYSAYFTTLSRALQDEIIIRTGH